MKLSSLSRSLAALRRDRRGNVMMIMGFAIVPLTFATGMVIDYSRAARLQTKLNALADAAGLAAVTAPMMTKPYQAACNTARDAFRNQLHDMKEVEFDNANLQISLTESYSGSSDTTIVCPANNVGVPSGQAIPLSRSVSVTYAAKSPNMFAGILGKTVIDIGGLSKAGAKVAPDLDMYMMLDVSSSMALPTTSAGIAQMKAMTGNCAFACHQSNPETSDGTPQYNSQGQRIDFYTAAHNANITLRVDAAKVAIQNMATKAIEAMGVNNAIYRMSVSTFARASNFVNLVPLTSNLATARTQAGNAQTVIVQKNSSNWDRQTEHADSLVKAGELMPAAAGTGTKRPGDTPQSILFIVTDGMRDEERGGRQMGPITADQCTALKARPNTRIAVLYTTYDPASIAGDGWSQTNVAWRLPQLGPALEACASPGLFFEVSTDGSISDALTELFDRAIASASIVQ